MKYSLVAENREGLWLLWKGDKSPTIGNAYSALIKAEVSNGFCFSEAKAYRGRKLLREFKAEDINQIIRSKWRIANK